MKQPEQVQGFETLPDPPAPPEQLAAELERAREELETFRTEAEQAQLRWQSRLAEASSRIHERNHEVDALREHLELLGRQLVHTAHESELRGAALERLRDQRAAEVDPAKLDDAQAARELALAERAAQLEERERALVEPAAQLEERERALVERAAQQEERERALVERNLRVERREQELAEREGELERLHVRVGGLEADLAVLEEERRRWQAREREGHAAAERDRTEREHHAVIEREREADRERAREAAERARETAERAREEEHQRILQRAREESERAAREQEELEREAARVRSKLQRELELQLAALGPGAAALPEQPGAASVEPFDELWYEPARTPDLLADLQGTRPALPRRMLDRAASLLLPAGTRRRGLFDWLQTRARR